MRSQFTGLASRFGAVRTRSSLSIVGSICLVHMLSGCILGSEKPEIVVEIPPAYRNAGPKPYAALPTYEWWRGFRSRELTALIDEAQQANLDIAAVVGRILQADAQARPARARRRETVRLLLPAPEAPSVWLTARRCRPVTKSISGAKTVRP